MKEKKYGPVCAEEVLKSLCNALCTMTWFPTWNGKRYDVGWVCVNVEIIWFCDFYNLEFWHKLRYYADVTITLGAAISVDEVRKCMGNPEADEDNAILINEQNAQVCVQLCQSLCL
jgi:hypothetical protein